jgi:hypothetical protein
MRLRGLSVLVLGLAVVSGRADDSKRIEETERLLKELKAALKSIKDGPAAKAALPGLRRLDKQVAEIVRDLEKRKPDRKDADRLEKAAHGLTEDMTRLDVDPKMPKAVRDLSLFRRFRESMKARARIDVEALSSLVEAYKLNNGDYPADLAALAKKQPSGGAPLVPKDRLRDPWGRAYQLDPAGKRNGGLKADVWSPGHPLEKKLIGNWESTKDGKDKGKKKGGGP